jgi:hypothetical protein
MGSMEVETVGPGGYMPQITSVEVIGDYSVRLTFTDGLVREVDLTRSLWGPVMLPLRDPAYFAKVRVDPESGTITWPNGVDFDPDVLHGDFEPDWPDGQHGWDGHRETG